MSNTAIKFEGVEQVRKALAGLPSELRKSAETAVLRAGAKPILVGEKARCPISDPRLKGQSKYIIPGQLKKSLGVSVRTIKGNKSIRIGPRGGFAIQLPGKKIHRKGKMAGKESDRWQDPVKYAHLIELGTSHSKANPFIRQAIESAKGETFNNMADGLETHLTKVCEKLRTAK